MSSSRTTVDKISCDAEIEPSVVRDEDTASSSLNEAPRSEFDNWWCVPDFAKHWAQQDIDLLREFAWQRYQCGYFESLRDGQPAPTPSR